MEKIEKYLNYVITLLLILVLFRTCGISSELKRQDKKINEITNKVNKVDSLSITKDDMIKIIKETPNWKTLEIEELSDKNKVPVNYYKNMDK
jgi:hypothetical protein